MARFKLLQESDLKDGETKRCDLCCKKMNDPIIFGDKMSKSDITVHYYCLLLSTNLPQKGSDNQGILGFLIQDIRKEIREAKNRSCMYCDDRGASIACNTCNKYFHLCCGSTMYCQNEFIDKFQSYCHMHITIKIEEVPESNASCRICYGSMMPSNSVNSIMANCCGFGWVHSICLKKYALKAGYYLKCLWCSSSLFREQIRYQGIFVPDRDAAWELDNHNFSGLYENYQNCDAEICLAPHGRQNKKGENYKKDWKILVCNTCGSSGIHQLCYSKNAVQQYTCNSCLNVFNNTIIPNLIPSYRTVVNDHLILSIPFIKNNENANKTLFMEKSSNNTTDDNDFLQDDTNLHTVKKLYKYNLTKQKIVSVVLAYVDDPERNKYNENELNIFKEVKCGSDRPLTEDFIWNCHREVLAEAESQKILNDGLDIVVEDSDDDKNKTALDLLNEITNKIEIQVPKPIIESAK